MSLATWPLIPYSAPLITRTDAALWPTGDVAHASLGPCIPRPVYP